MKKNNRPPRTMPRHEAVEHSEPPSPQALIERRRAEDAAARNPLAYALGEPLPGRSALDKMRAREKASEGDNVIALKGREAYRGRTNRISPGTFHESGRTAIHRHDR